MILCSAILAPDAVQPPVDTLTTQVAAAKAAGFTGISLWSLHEAVARSGGLSAEEVRQQILSAGLEVPMIEAILPWDEADSATAIENAKSTFALAQSYDAKYVVAVSLSPARLDINSAASRLKDMCRQASDFGTTIAVEFLPWSGIPDLATAWKIIETADCDNAAIMLDAWHWQRQPGGPCHELLRQIPPQFIGVYQMCDAQAEPEGEPMDECTRARLLPGQGVIDLPALHGTLQAMGARPILAPEVFNTQLFAGGAMAMAQQVRQASLQALQGFDL